jgi:uncharacterized protein (DUF1501 family)
MLSRRAFLKTSGVALVAYGAVPEFLVRAAAAGGPRRKVLVTIFQRGAADGLNMIVPHGERAYYDARPTIAIPRPGSRDDAAIDLDGFFGLHPRLAPLAPLFANRSLAVVHACGSPDSTRSHFDAQDYMETATPGVKSTTDGWLNRCLHAREHRDATPFRAVAIAPQLPRSLLGVEPALAVERLDRFGIQAGRASGTVASSFEAQYAGAADARLGRTGTEAFDAMRALDRLRAQGYQPAGGAQYPRSPFGAALQQIAQLIKADVGLEIASAELGGWDHHVNEGASTGQLATRLDDLARGLAAFAADLGDRFSDLLVLTMSEFGRAVAENGSRGTDHGHGNAMLVLGGGVRGGKILGRWPGLARDDRFEGRDLAVTTDFREVFGEIARAHLEIAGAGALFPGHRLEAGRALGLLG